MEKAKKSPATVAAALAEENPGTGSPGDYTTRQKVAIGACIAAASIVFATGLYTMGTLLIKGWLALMYAMTCLGANPFGWSL